MSNAAKEEANKTEAETEADKLQLYEQEENYIYISRRRYWKDYFYILHRDYLAV